MTVQTSSNEKEDTFFVDTMLSQLVKFQGVVFGLAVLLLAYSAVQFQDYVISYWLGLSDNNFNAPWLQEMSNISLNFTAMLIYVFVISIVLQSSFWLYVKEVVRHFGNVSHARRHKDLPEKVSFMLYRRTIILIVIGVAMLYPWYLGFISDIVAQYSSIQGDPVSVINFQERMGAVLGTDSGVTMNNLAWVVSIFIAIAPELLAAAPSVVSGLREKDAYEKLIDSLDAAGSTSVSKPTDNETHVHVHVDKKK